MKLKKVAALCKKHKQAAIFQQWKYPSTGGPRYLAKQFISDGYAAYSAYGLPELTKESLLRIFDVKEEDFEKWRVSVDELPDSLDFRDDIDDEIRIETFYWPVVRNEETIYVFGTEGNGVLFVKEDYIAAAGESGYRTYFERRTRESGNPYIAVKNGVMLEAIILPVNILTESVVQDYRDLAFRMQKELINRGLPKITLDREEIQMADEPEEPEQMGI
ncbi:MAG: hypothetical protein IJ206_09290 [Oscillospiraceae bacterium]|nr:hypothetical protein [Oscillospiraceae bacterium]